jgi:RNase adaptor protein for sRNA GlmZ degradation
MSVRKSPLVTILSFSYRLGGCPDDSHGHGGGFVFDCRCLPNPGRLPTYADLDGLDPEVGAWLEGSPVVGPFLRDVASLVTAAVEEYGRRGFEHLQVAFGCTGGRHRSVYCALRLSDVLRAQGVRTTVIHRDLQAVGKRGSGAAHLSVERPTPK